VKSIDDAFGIKLRMSVSGRFYWRTGVPL